LPKEPIALWHGWGVPAEVNVPLGDGTTKASKPASDTSSRRSKTAIATIGIETQIHSVSNPRIRVQLIQRLAKRAISNST